MHRWNHQSKHAFPGFHKIHGPPTHQPTDHQPLTQRPTGYQPNDLLSQQSYLEDLTIETFPFFRPQAQLGKHIIILWYIIHKVYWFPWNTYRGVNYIYFSTFQTLVFAPPQIFQNYFLCMDFFFQFIVWVLCVSWGNWPTKVICSKDLKFL